MGTPDVRVRLSAEGQAEVIAAFRRLQDEANRTSRGAAKGFVDTNNALNGMHRLIGLVTTALAAIGISRVLRQANDLSETLQNLSLRLSTNARDLLAMDVALQRMGTDLPSVSRQLSAFFQITQDAAEGVGDAADKFRRLGLTETEIKRFASQDIAQRLETVAKAAHRVGDERERTAAFIDALGQRGAVLIPLLDELAKKGLGGLREQAVGLASDIDDKTVESLGRLNDAFDDLRITSRGLATQFLSGFAPAMTKALGAVTGELTSGQAAWVRFGEIAGEVLGFLLVQTTILADSIVTMFETVGKSMVFIGKAIKATLKGDFDTAKLYVESIGLAWEKAEEDQRKRAQVTFERFQGTRDIALGGRPKGGLTEDDAEAQAQAFDRQAKAKAAALDAQTAAEVAAAKASLKLREEIEQRAFSEGLVGVREYYARRRAIAVEAINAEIAALQRRRVEVDKGTDEKRLAELAKIDGEIKRLAIERSATIEDLNAKESDDVKRLARERLELDKRIFEARGDQHRATMAQIEEEVTKARLTFRQSGLPKEEADRRADAFRRDLETQEKFNNLSREANLLLGDFGRDRDAIQRRVEAGLISEVDGQKQIEELEKERIERLKEMARALIEVAEATGDPEKIAQAETFMGTIEDVEIALEKQSNAARRFSAVLSDAVTGQLASFFQTSSAAAETFGEKFTGVIRGIIGELQRLAAQILATKIVTSLFSLFGGGGTAGIPGEASLPVAAVGGVLTGGGTSTSDSILVQGRNGPFWGSVGEYVMPASKVAQPGVLGLLESIRSGSSGVAVRSRGNRYADGGLVPGPGPSGRIDGKVTVGLGPGLVLSELDTPDGDRLFVQMATRNRRAMNRVLGG